MCAALRRSAEHVREHLCATVTNRPVHQLRCAMREECRRSLAPRAALRYLRCRDDNAERARRSRTGRLAQAPRRLQTLAATASRARRGVYGTNARRTPVGASIFTPAAPRCMSRHVGDPLRSAAPEPPESVPRAMGKCVAFWWRLYIGCISVWFSATISMPWEAPPRLVVGRRQGQGRACFLRCDRIGRAQSCAKL